MVPILVEPAYSNSVWCVSLLEGLTGEFKQKRIPFCQINALEEVPPGEQYLYLIGSDAEWVKAALTACNQFGIYPILLCNQSYHTFDADYSAVCSDVMNSTRRLVELLHQRGCRRIALYGVNPRAARRAISPRCRGRRGSGTSFTTAVRWKIVLGRSARILTTTTR